MPSLCSHYAHTMPTLCSHYAHIMLSLCPYNAHTMLTQYAHSMLILCPHYALTTPTLCPHYAHSMPTLCLPRQSMNSIAVDSRNSCHSPHFQHVTNIVHLFLVFTGTDITWYEHQPGMVASRSGLTNWRYLLTGTFGKPGEAGNVPDLTNHQLPKNSQTLNP